MTGSKGTVLAMAVRPDKGVPMVEITEAAARTGRGLAGDERAKGKRGITLICSGLWSRSMADLAADLPWHTRRANILTEGIDLSAAIGKRIRIGKVEVLIDDETRPCGLMDELYDGLRKALVPDCRGGVLGEILNDETIRVGDTVELI